MECGGAEKDSKTPEYVCVCPGKTGLSSMKLVWLIQITG